MTQKILAIGWSIFFITLGAVAFIPNPYIGADSLIMTNGAHNFLHIGTGLALLVGAFLLLRWISYIYFIFGTIYLALVVLEHVQGTMVLGGIMTNMIMLHVTFGILLFVLGYISRDTGDGEDSTT